MSLAEPKKGPPNHNVYFDTIGGSGGPATVAVATLINDAYGHLEKQLTEKPLDASFIKDGKFSIVCVEEKK